MKTTTVRKIARCLHCGHVWHPILENPRVCPKCKSYSWKELPRYRMVRSKAQEVEL